MRRAADGKAELVAVASPPGIEGRLDRLSTDAADKTELADASPRVAEGSKSVTEPPKAAMAANGAERKKAQETKRAQRKVDEKPQPPVKLAETASGAVVRAKHGSANGWQSSLREELALCEQSSFFSRLICNEKARWKYCPGHWGSIKECPGTVTTAP